MRILDCVCIVMLSAKIIVSTVANAYAVWARALVESTGWTVSGSALLRQPSCAVINSSVMNVNIGSLNGKACKENEHTRKEVS